MAVALPTPMFMKRPQVQTDPGPNLVLIGYRATGKTSVGARLAKIRGRPFVDLDRVLVTEADKSVEEIVAHGGWEDFRRREKELVARYRGTRGLVLATGGGVVLDPENVAALKENGVLIWLTADAAVIRERLSRDEKGPASRPSLTGRDPGREVAEVLAFRQPLYQAAAQIIIGTDQCSISEVVDLILAALHDKEVLGHGG